MNRYRWAVVGLSLLFTTATGAQSDLDADLQDAVLFADPVMVKNLLDQGADANFQVNRRGMLAWAAQGGNLEVVQALIDAGAEIDAVDGVGHTALMRAVEVEFVPIVRALLPAGADPDLRATYGRTAAMMAAEQGQVELVELLLEAGADFDLTDAEENTAALLAAQSGADGRHDILTRMGAAGVNLNSSNAAYTPLSYAVEQADGELVRTLLDAGADPNAVSHNGDIPLLLAASEPAIMRHLLAAGADPNATNRWGETVMFAVVEYGRVEDLQALIDAGADPRHAQGKGQTVLQRAEVLNRGDMVEALQALGIADSASEAVSTPAASAGNPVGAPARSSSGSTGSELADMPKLDVLTELSGVAAKISYFSGATVADLLDFYGRELGQRGWSVEQENSDRENYASSSYRRGDETLTFSLGLDSSSSPSRVMVTLTPVGTLSASTLPRYPGTTALYESAATSMYVSDDSVVEVGDATLKLLRDDGWQGSPTTRNDEMQLMELTKAGTTLSVYISIAPAQGNRTSIQYSLRQTGN